MPPSADIAPPQTDDRILEDLAFIHEHLDSLRTIALTMNCEPCQEVAFLIELAMTATREAGAVGVSTLTPTHSGTAQVQ